MSRQTPTSPNVDRPWIGISLAIGGAVAFSVKSIVVKLAFGYGVDAITMVAYRMIFALPLFLLLAWWTSRGKPALSLADWLSVCVLGFFGSYLTCVFDFAGLQYVSASLERLIVYLTPTLVLMLNVVVLKRAFQWRQVGALALSYAGVLLVFGREASFAGENVKLGAGLVFASAACYAIYLTHTGEVVRKLGAARLAGFASTVASVFCIGHFLLIKPLTDLVVAPEVLWLSAINGTVCTFFPVVMVMMAIGRIGAPMAAQCGMAGPIATIALGVWVLGEPFTVWEAAGTVAVMGGIWLLTRSPVKLLPDSASASASAKA